MLEFQSMLFNTRLELAEAVAAEWLPIKYGVPDDVPAEWDACASAWDLDDEWLSERGLDANDMRAAFVRHVTNAAEVE